MSELPQTTEPTDEYFCAACGLIMDEDNPLYASQQLFNPETLAIPWYCAACYNTALEQLDSR